MYYLPVAEGLEGDIYYAVFNPKNGVYLAINVDINGVIIDIDIARDGVRIIDTSDIPANSHIRNHIAWLHDIIEANYRNNVVENDRKYDCVFDLRYIFDCIAVSDDDDVTDYDDDDEFTFGDDDVDELFELFGPTSHEVRSDDELLFEMCSDRGQSDDEDEYDDYPTVGFDYNAFIATMTDIIDIVDGHNFEDINQANITVLANALS